MTNYLKFWQSNLTKDMDNCIYIDIPFCESSCGYCIYGSSVVKDQYEIEDYIQNYLLKFIEYYNTVFCFPPNQIYLGGGTASILTLEQMERIFNNIKWFADIKHKCFEGNPKSLTEDKIDYLTNVGFSYISLGLQTFDKKEIARVNRNWFGAMELRKLIDVIHQKNAVVSVDLMTYINGVSEQSIMLLKEDLEIMSKVCKPDIICINPTNQSIYNKFLKEQEVIYWLRKVAETVVEFVKEHDYIYPRSNEFFYSNLDDDDVILGRGGAAHNLKKRDNIEQINKAKTYSCNYGKNVYNQTVFAMGGYKNRIVHSHFSNIARWIISNTNGKIIIKTT